MSDSRGHDAPCPEWWALTLTPQPDHPVSGIQRVRFGLKALLRAFGLKCIGLREGGVPVAAGAGDGE